MNTEITQSQVEFYQGNGYVIIEDFLTPAELEAMTCAFMPDGSTFNGISNVLPEEELAHLQIGDLLNNDAVNPLIFKQTDLKERDV